MLDALSLGLVGLAVLTPSLFDDGIAGTARDVASIAIVPVITDGQRAAMQSLRGSIAGVATSDPSDMQALHRLTEVRDALRALRGPADDNPIQPALTYADLDAVLGAFISAVQAGNAADKLSYRLVAGDESTLNPADSYIVGILDSLELVQQSDNLAGLVLTPLGQALKAAMDLRASTLTDFTGTADDAGASMIVVARLASEMDQAGYIVIGHAGDAPDAGDALDSIGYGFKELPHTLDTVTVAAADAIGGAIGGVAGNLVGGILFSTPVLLLVAGLVVWKVTK